MWAWFHVWCLHFLIENVFCKRNQDPFERGEGLYQQLMNIPCIYFICICIQYRQPDPAARDVYSMIQHYKDLKIGNEQYSEFCERRSGGVVDSGSACFYVNLSLVTDTNTIVLEHIFLHGHA